MGDETWKKTWKKNYDDAKYFPKKVLPRSFCFDEEDEGGNAPKGGSGKAYVLLGSGF